MHVSSAVVRPSRNAAKRSRSNLCPECPLITRFRLRRHFCSATLICGAHVTTTDKEDLVGSTRFRLVLRLAGASLTKFAPASKSGVGAHDVGAVRNNSRRNRTGIAKLNPDGGLSKGPRASLTKTILTMPTTAPLCRS